MKDVAYCSFCGKSNAEVAHLIAGPKVCICDGCISLSCKIIDERSEMDVIEAKDPLAAKMLHFLDKHSGALIDKAVAISDDLLAEKLDTDTEALKKSEKLLTRKKKITVVPVMAGFNMYLVNGKDVTKDYIDSEDLYRIAVHLMLKPNPKFKLLP